ncbi:hypothetical protein [Frankia sp. AgB32]|uniref:hypothetical protein n=1 Tax=Frankia sp. AgB32 TaxID=631119 RepID=UPI00200EB667|nr:hypothetical protein [Frankia sp. AgB32]MCK9895216.1 hypothetical protein [Frankia sp. AgB32]
MPGLILAGSLLTLTACSTASYDERMAYLRKTAARGVEAHRLMASQGARIDAKRCHEAFVAVGNSDIPNDVNTGHVSDEWRAQVTAFYVDSCVSGLPRPVPGDPRPTSGRTSQPAPTSTLSTTRDAPVPAPRPDPSPPLTLHPAPTGTPPPSGS